jgi:hypothetical protein
MKETENAGSFAEVKCKKCDTSRHRIGECNWRNGWCKNGKYACFKTDIKPKLTEIDIMP